MYERVSVTESPEIYTAAARAYKAKAQPVRAGLLLEYWCRLPVSNWPPDDYKAADDACMGVDGMRADTSNSRQRPAGLAGS
jgi:hypothetical protein